MSSFNNNNLYLDAYMADVTAATSTFIAIPTGVQGELEGIVSTYDAALTGADAVITVKANGATVGTHTIAFTGSAAGTVTETSFANKVVNGPTVIEIASDGGPTNASAVPAHFTVRIRR